MEVPFGWGWVPLMLGKQAPATDSTCLIDISGQPATILSSHSLSPESPVSHIYDTFWTQLNNKCRSSGDDLSVQPFSELGPLVSGLLLRSCLQVVGVKSDNRMLPLDRCTGGCREKTFPLGRLLGINRGRLTGDLSLTFLPAVHTHCRRGPAVS